MFSAFVLSFCGAELFVIFWIFGPAVSGSVRQCPAVSGSGPAVVRQGRTKKDALSDLLVVLLLNFWFIFSRQFPAFPGTPRQKLPKKPGPPTNNSPARTIMFHSLTKTGRDHHHRHGGRGAALRGGRLQADPSLPGCDGVARSVRCSKRREIVRFLPADAHRGRRYFVLWVIDRVQGLSVFGDILEGYFRRRCQSHPRVRRRARP